MSEEIFWPLEIESLVNAVKSFPVTQSSAVNTGIIPSVNRTPLCLEFIIRAETEIPYVFPFEAELIKFVSLCSLAQIETIKL